MHTPLAVFLLSGLAGLAAAQGPDGPTEAPEAVLLLKNGQVMEGRIARAGDYYQVLLTDGEVRVRAADVQFACKDLNEVYQRKRATAQPGSLQDHLLLAQWCLRHGLVGAAANELSTAKEIEPNHPTIALLQRRIQIAIETRQGPDASAPPGPRGATPEDLDRLVRGMPHGTVEAFAQVVQPLLMNHCMAAGCHGTQPEGKMSLLRVPQGQPPGRRLTQRNLHAVMQWVHRDNPAASRFLTAASGPHGTAKAAIFTDHQVSQYRKMVQWVYRVAQQAPPLPPEGLAAEAAEPGFDDLSPPRLLPPRAGHPKPISKAGSAAARSTAADKAGGEKAEQAAYHASDGPGTGPRSPASRRSYTPPKPTASPDESGSDPFDPEAFNRQLGPPEQKPAPSALSTPAKAAMQDKPREGCK